jgi:hypothetical protein
VNKLNPDLSEKMQDALAVYKKAVIDELLHALESPPLLEEMAALEHDRWSGWEFYRETCLRGGERRKPDDPETYEERWHRLRETSYADLPEESKESDRREARKTRDLIVKFLKKGM